MMFTCGGEVRHSAGQCDYKGGHHAVEEVHLGDGLLAVQEGDELMVRVGVLLVPRAHGGPRDSSAHARARRPYDARGI